MTGLEGMERYVGIHLMLDTNRINSRSTLPHMNQLEQWKSNGVIRITMGETSHEEALAGSDAVRTEKALQYIYHIPMCNTPEEQAKLAAIEIVLFPGGARTQSQKNDVVIAFTASKYHRYLVTDDGGSRGQPGGLLGRRDLLAQHGIKVLRDFEAVDLVREKIKYRDDLETKFAVRAGRAAAPWVSQD